MFLIQIISRNGFSNKSVARIVFENVIFILTNFSTIEVERNWADMETLNWRTDMAGFEPFPRFLADFPTGEENQARAPSMIYHTAGAAVAAPTASATVKKTKRYAHLTPFACWCNGVDDECGASSSKNGYACSSEMCC